jgi:hypothetical protein
VAWQFVPFGEFAPDQSRYILPSLGGGFTQTASNVIPRAKISGPSGLQVSYGPLPSFAVLTSALTAQCQGAYTHLSTAQAVYTFAGDATKLYMLTTGETAFTDVSGATYDITAEDWWDFAAWGDQIIATDGQDPVQQYTIGTNTSFTELANGGINSLSLTAGSGYTNGTYALSVTNPGSGSGFTGTVTVSGGSLTSYSITADGSGYPQTATIAVPAGAGSGTGGAITPSIAWIAPVAKYCEVVRDFLFFGYTTDPTNGTRPQRIWWSGIGDPTNWTSVEDPGTAAAAAVQSDYDEIEGEWGQIRGLVAAVGGADLVVFLERAIFIYNYSGPPATFSRVQIQGARGTYSPKSIVKLDDVVFFLGTDGFYSFDGSTTQPIGLNYVDNFVLNDCLPSYIDRVVGTADPVNRCIWWIYPGAGSSNGVPNKIVLYQPYIGEWSTGTFSGEFVFPAITYGYTLDQLGTLYATLDDVPYPLDSPVWVGNRLLLAGFNSSHEFGFLNGSPMAAIVETPQFQVGGGEIPANQRAVLMNTRPIFNNASTGSVSVCVGYKDTLDETFTYTATETPNSNGECPFRQAGRYFVAQEQIDANGWDLLSGVEVDLRPFGTR